MDEKLHLTHPWLLAVWPGMGHVAVNAGVYLLSKLGMTAFAEVESGDLFDVDAVEVKEGLIHPVRKPRNRFFTWIDPNRKHDLVLFVGEAQPPVGRFAFCRRLIGFARDLGIERVFTFAAMATQMHPEHPSRLFGAATDETNLEELKRLECEILQDGHIGGLNGVLLGAAAEAGLNGVCLLGEMPHIFAQVPFPKASHAILEVFTVLAGIDLELDELAEQARDVEEQLGEVLARIEEQSEQEQPDEEGEESYEAEGEIAEEPPTLPVRKQSAARDKVEEMFAAAERDRSKAFELKQELDRLGLFKEYEDRFLDLFQKPE